MIGTPRPRVTEPPARSWRGGCSNSPRVRCQRRPRRRGAAPLPRRRTCPALPSSRPITAAARWPTRGSRSSLPSKRGGPRRTCPWCRRCTASRRSTAKSAAAPPQRPRLDPRHRLEHTAPGDDHGQVTRERSLPEAMRFPPAHAAAAGGGMAAFAAVAPTRGRPYRGTAAPRSDPSSAADPRWLMVETARAAGDEPARSPTTVLAKRPEIAVRGSGVSSGGQRRDQRSSLAAKRSVARAVKGRPERAEKFS